MGKIIIYKSKIVIRTSVDEVLTSKVVSPVATAFSLAEMIAGCAGIIAREKKVDLPEGVIATSFDPVRSEFVVTFSRTVEDAI
jgi:hypothetical protein